MPYRLQIDESVVDGIRRIGREQSAEALERLADLQDLADDVHDARKRCKKLRGLVRLVRPGMEDEYQRANTAFRDAARQLAPMRDAHALVATFDVMLSVSPVDPEAFSSVRAALAEDVERAIARDDVRLRVDRATELIQAGASRIPEWGVDDPSSAIEAGLKKTYGRGRRRVVDSIENGSVEDRHEWRKRVKYGWYHVRLLREAAPSILRPLGNRMHDLSDALGDDHDLAVLSSVMDRDPSRFGSEDVVASSRRLIAGWQFELQNRALSLGRRLYIESPKRHSQRLAAYVDVWERHGEELKAGEIIDIA